MYKELIQKDFGALEREKSNSTKKNNKETEFERSIADRAKSRKQKLDIISKNKEKNKQWIA